MFEQAVRMKLRFATTKGMLSVEDLWDLTITALNAIAVSLNKELKAVNEESFLDEGNKVDEVTRLKFNISLHILKTKQAEKKARADDTIKKAKRQKILGIMAAKKDEALEAMSESELQKQLDEL